MRNARKYKHRIEVYAQTETDDTYGGSTLSGALLSKAWADIRTVNEDKLQDYGLNETSGAIVAHVRKHDAIDWGREDIYVVYKGKNWFISSVTEVNLWDVEYRLVLSHGSG